MQMIAVVNIACDIEPIPDTLLHTFQGNISEYNGRKEVQVSPLSFQLMSPTNFWKSVLRFTIDPALNKFKNLIMYIREGKDFFITFDYSFAREGEDIGKFSYIYTSSASFIWNPGKAINPILSAKY